MPRMRTYGPLASKSRDSPARPGRKSTASTYAGCGGKPFLALKFGSLIVSCDHGITTFATQLDAGRTSSFMNGIVASLRCASAGIVGTRSWVRPRSSDGCTSWRSCVMNGRLASIIGPVLLTPGISARASVRSGGNAAFSALNAGIRGRQRLRQLGDGVLERDVLARERVGRRVEVGDQVLQVLRVGVDRRGDRALRGDPVRQVVGLDPERVVGDDRRVLVGRQPVLDRAVVRRAGLLDRGAVLLQQDLQVLAGVRPAARSAPGRSAPARFPAGSGTCDRCPRPAPPACRDARRRRSCPRGRSAGGSRTSRRRAAAGPASGSTSSPRRRRTAGVAVTLQPGTVETLLTSPTLTPAIRTNEFGRSPLALENIACTVYGLANGFANFVNPRYVNTRIATIAITPAANVLMPPLRLRLRLMGSAGWRAAAARSGGCALNVSPAGTRVRPWNVGP